MMLCDGFYEFNSFCVTVMHRLKLLLDSCDLLVIVTVTLGRVCNGSIYYIHGPVEY